MHRATMPPNSLSSLATQTSPRHPNSNSLSPDKKVGSGGMKRSSSFHGQPWDVLGIQQSSNPFNPLLTAVLLFLPFLLPLLFYPVITVLLYAMAVVVYYAFLIAIVVSEISMRPPWYHHRPGATQLSEVDVPDYYRGIFSDPRTDWGLDYTDVSFTNPRGMLLRGWLVKGRARTSSGAGVIFDADCDVVIAVHGGGRDRRAFLRHIPLFNQQGISMLLFDLSEHGLSDGAERGFTYGINEQYDVLAAIDFVRNRCNFSRIGVLGTSVGASTSILAATQTPHIDWLIAENGMTSAGDLMEFHINRAMENYLPRLHSKPLFRQPFMYLCKRVLYYRIGAPFLFGAIDVIPQLTCPILILHGTRDDVIPHSHSTLLHDAAVGEKYLWLVEGGSHCALYDRDQALYSERVTNFILSAWCPQQSPDLQ
eukprot:gnl/Hemi2/24503_TR8243_c0_g2_i1.p1 gnl/Hemi2/24503_TR8243_c0_g2~~gnl/Hemi2/24503_TR8243_c0_g2_i1.p1  ORF type:complete len:423 (-),score=97.84 gnl/Hemi2/24503_TR8243_c0_g2_i1:87-1355(-)